MPAPTLAQFVQLLAPFLVSILALFGVPVLVALFRMLNARAAAIKNETWRDLAEVAVHAVEQVLAKAPSVSKREEGMRILMSFGVPAAEASALLESTVHAMNNAAAELGVIAASAAPLAPPSASVGSSAGVIEMPAGPPSTQPH